MPKLPILPLLVWVWVFVNGVLAFAAAEETRKRNESGGDIGVSEYELRKGNISMKITNLGASIMSIVLPDRHGKLADVVLGFDSPDEYKNNPAYFGSVVGRVANRIENAQFTLNGKLYKLVPNEGNNTLHGGPKGFSDVVWRVIKYKNEGHTPRIAFGYESKDGEEGFPGKIEAFVTYKLIGEDQLRVKMKGKSLTKPTPINLSQHTYWNLGGHDRGDILSHDLQIFGHSITPFDSHLIPTGFTIPVLGTRYDFLQSRLIGRRIGELPKGYHINYVLDQTVGGGKDFLRKAAVLRCGKTGRVMELSTNQPAMQFYTGNALGDAQGKGKGGFLYKKYAGVCLETQKFPDAVNHPNFPSVIVNPGKSVKQLMVYRFWTEPEGGDFVM